MKKIFITSISLFFVFACNRANSNQEMAENYFEIYSKRKELDKMNSFYAPQFEYENVAFESETNDFNFLFKELYGWSDPNFKFAQPETIKIDKIVTNDSTIVAMGATMPYTYNGKEVEGTRFVITLELDKDKKIKKQTDWFDYPMQEIIEAYYLKKNMTIE